MQTINNSKSLGQAELRGEPGCGGSDSWWGAGTRGLRVCEKNTKISQPPTPHTPKRPKLHSGKENHHLSPVFPKHEDTEGVMYLWQSLPDELMLLIFQSLPLTPLVRASGVCKRWHRLAFDESLWQGVDVAGMSVPEGLLLQALESGLRLLRGSRCVLRDVTFTSVRTLCVQHLDLSHAMVSAVCLQRILCRCVTLINLSLEGLTLSDDIICAVSHNTGLVRLNVSTCSGFHPWPLSSLLTSCPSLDEVNMSWCCFTDGHVRDVTHSLPHGLTQLNISGYRDRLNNSDVQVICSRCPKLITLDLSDCGMLTADCVQDMGQLSQLQHLSLSRCHQIPATALLQLSQSVKLKSLNVYGVESEFQVKELLPHVTVNACPITSVARPSLDGEREHMMWGMQCRLALNH